MMTRSRAVHLALMVALLALASPPPAKAATCSPKIPDCSGCCATQENLCTRGCGLNSNCFNNCLASYMLCIRNC